MIDLEVIRYHREHPCFVEMPPCDRVVCYRQVRSGTFSENSPNIQFLLPASPSYFINSPFHQKIHKVPDKTVLGFGEPIKTSPMVTSGLVYLYRIKNEKASQQQSEKASQ